MKYARDTLIREAQVLTANRYSRALGRAVTVAALLACVGACTSVDSVSSAAVEGPELADRELELANVTEYPVASAEEARLRAENALAARDYDLALHLYVEAVKLDPEDSESLYRIGALHEQRGNKELATRAYAQCVAIDSRHAFALQGLGAMQFENGDIDAALKNLKKAVAVDTTLHRAHNLLGVIADTNGEYEQAAEHYSAALSQRPRTASILNNRAYSHYMAGNFDIAKADLLEVIDIDPTYEKAWHNLGLVYAREGDYERAKRTLTRVVGPHVAANDVGYVAMLEGDYAAAERLFDEAMRLSPRYYETAEQNLLELRRRRGSEPQPSLAVER